MTREPLKPRAKLSFDDVLAIRRSSQSGSALARRYGVNRSTISRVRAYKAWEIDAS